MKRRLIYGLLISLFVCASGMVGYGQTDVSVVAGWGSATINGPEYCSGIPYFSIAENPDWCNYKCIVNGNNISKVYTIEDNDNIREGFENDGIKVKGGNPNFYITIDEDKSKIILSKTAPICGPSISVSISDKKLHQGDVYEIKPIISKSNVPEGYTILYAWYVNGTQIPAPEGTDETLFVNTESLGSYTYKLEATLYDETHTKVKSEKDEATIQVLDAGAALWPECYDLLDEDGNPFNVCTDENGDLLIDLELHKYVDSGVLTIPAGMTINCRDFIIRGDGERNNSENTGIVCEGKIICTRDFKIDKVGCYNSANNRPYFRTTCSATIQAKTSYVEYVYDIQPFYGNWISESLTVKNGNGQDVYFPLCSYVKTDLMKIEANVSNGVKINGHLISQKITSTKDLYIEYNGTTEKSAIITIGDLEGVYSKVKIIADQYTVVNLCKNPTVGDGTITNSGRSDESRNGADDIGYFKGTILYNTGVNGWPITDWHPEDEWDINHTNDGRYSAYRAQSLIAAYDSYSDCIAEKNMASFLAIDDDPFIPKDKEIKILYDDFNPCSEEYESSKVQIREMGGKWFRVINGELIYCENDN